MTRCTNDNVKKLYLSIFNEFGFVPNEPTILLEPGVEGVEVKASTNIEEKVKLVKLFKIIYLNMINTNENNIVYYLSRKRHLIKYFWFNIKKYKNANINYNKKLCENEKRED
jgi:hypothetical protein